MHEGIVIWKEVGRAKRKDACNIASPAGLLSFSFDTGLFLVYAWA